VDRVFTTCFFVLRLKERESEKGKIFGSEEPSKLSIKKSNRRQSRSSYLSSRQVTLQQVAKIAGDKSPSLAGQHWPDRLLSLSGNGSPSTEQHQHTLSLSQPRYATATDQYNNGNGHIVSRDGFWSPTSERTGSGSTSRSPEEANNNNSGGFFHMADAGLHHCHSNRSYGRLSISSASTTSSGASSMVGRTMSSCSPDSSTSSSPPYRYSPPPADEPVAKIEELDDDDKSQLMSVPQIPTALTNSGEPVKRGRGRPRKHPVQPPKTVQKVTKGRSKTGCITCRRRKKKCDETKPECTLHLPKENYVCAN